MKLVAVISSIKTPADGGATGYDNYNAATPAILSELWERRPLTTDSRINGDAIYRLVTYVNR